LTSSFIFQNVHVYVHVQQPYQNVPKVQLIHIEKLLVQLTPQKSLFYSLLYLLGISPAHGSSQLASGNIHIYVLLESI